jgi:NAD(P)H-quinone oxidoreductase subunit 5
MSPSTLTSLIVSFCLLSPFISLLLSWSKQRWEIANISALIGLFSALTIWFSTLLNVSFFGPSTLVHFTGVTSTVLLLVHFVGYIVLKYAHRNFDRDPDNKRFLTWYLMTLFSVMVTVVSNHLLLLWLGWVSVSICLHQLLMFYPQRYRAVLAAHKKFIFARTAETFLAMAFLILYFEHGSANIDKIFINYPLENLGLNLHIAAVLISIVVLIKCAQLPLHGWLIQVVESPTPVSALLHAGIVNMGGLLLLVFSPLFSQSLPAQILVLIFASSSAAFAALVMMSITSIKVRLAWSTIAQMGLMLLECALGLYAIALLHLVAHSVYKAHAFLSSGEAVSNHSIRENNKVTTSTLDWQLATIITVATFIAVTYSGLISAPFSPWIILSGTSLILLANRNLLASPFKAILPVFGLILVYVTLKIALTSLLPSITHQYYWQFDLAVSVLFLGLLLGYILLFVTKPIHLPLSIVPLLNAGFYLDEWSTRITLRIWPISLPKKQVKH